MTFAVEPDSVLIAKELVTGASASIAPEPGIVHSARVQEEEKRNTSSRF